MLVFTADYSFSGRRRTDRQRGTCGDLVSINKCRLSLAEVLIMIGCVIGVMYACCGHLCLYSVLEKIGRYDLTVV
jgi:hypothetical protein